MVDSKVYTSPHFRVMHKAPLVEVKHSPPLPHLSTLSGDAQGADRGGEADGACGQRAAHPGGGLLPLLRAAEGSVPGQAGPVPAAGVEKCEGAAVDRACLCAAEGGMPGQAGSAPSAGLGMRGSRRWGRESVKAMGPSPVATCSTI